MSLDLLYVMSTREDYDRFSRFIKPETISSECNQVIKDCGEYYKQHSTDEIDWNDFSTWFKIVKHSNYKEIKLQIYDKIFTNLSTYIPTTVADKIIERYVLQDYCMRISDISLKGAEGDEVEIDDIKDLIEDYDKELDRVSALETFVVTEDIVSLTKTVIEGGLNWRLSFLNKSIGTLRKGKLVCFAARPNTGKTTFLASECTHLVEQLPDDQVALWFNNEEAGSDVKFRIVQSAIGWTSDDIRNDPTSALKAYEAAIGHKDKIVLVDKADLDTKDMEEFLKNYKVGLIIIDQLWKVHGFEKNSGTDTARLGNIYQWAREIAKKYAPIVTVHQVKTEGEGVKWLTPNMLYLSGTVIQGEVDSLILMGRSYDPGQEKNRYISIGKNKGAYGPTVDINLREGKSEILIQPELAYFEEIENDN